MTINATLFAFVAEPTLNYLGMYKIFGWYYYYPFPIYIFIGISHKWIIEILKSIKQKYHQ